MTTATTKELYGYESIEWITLVENHSIQRIPIVVRSKNIALYSLTILKKFTPQAVMLTIEMHPNVLQYIFLLECDYTIKNIKNTN